METVAIVTESVVPSPDNYSGHISEYTDLIHKNGAAAVILSVFIMLLLGVVAYILKSNQKTTNQMINQQKELFNLLLELARKEEKKKEEEENKPKIIKEPNLVELFLKINGSIKDTLKDVSDHLDSDRTSVYVFHNGVFSSHGLPFFKISCVCEIVKKNTGVVKNLSNHSGLPLQMFDNTISDIYKGGSMIILDSDDEANAVASKCPVLCGMLKNNNIKSAVGVAIYDHDNNIMGIIMVEFTALQDEESLAKVVDYLTNEKAPVLAPVLEMSGIYDTTK